MNSTPPTSVTISPETAGDVVFPPHGRYVARVDGQIIRSEVTGPLNLEMIERYQRVEAMWVEAASRGRFGILTVMRGSMMMGPDAMRKFIAVTSELKSRVPHFSGIAQVAARDIEGRSLMAELYRKKVYEPLGVAYDIFESEEDAEAWLRTVL
jgi:hypothetical protein